MVLERKSEPEVRKGVLGKRKRARIEKKTPPEKKTKIEYLMSHFFAAPGSKTDVKMDPEIWKNRSSTFLSVLKKTEISRRSFSLIFDVSGRREIAKSSQNDVQSFKIEGSTVS